VKVMHVEMGRHLYGGARQVAYLLDGVNAHSGQHVLVCPKDSRIAEAITNPAVNVLAVPMKGDHDVGFVNRLRQLIRAERPDLLHIHSRRGDMLTALAGKLENLTMIHSRRVDNPPRWLDLHIKFPLFERIVTISRGILQVLREHGVSERRLICVPSAVDTDRYRPTGQREAIRAELGLGAHQPVLAIVAQLIARKGHAVLFKALPKVLARQPDLVLLVFGQGQLETELRELAGTLGLAASVRFEGFRKDLDRIIPAIDLLVHPAWMEGLGVCLLETAACGVPIVACRAGGIPEAVRHGLNGYLVEPGDSDGLAAAMNELLDHPDLLRKFGDNGRRLILDEFSIARMVEGNLEVYRTLLDRQA
jgi:glycosyltransferase involved in cell wall biosynthesis